MVMSLTASIDFTVCVHAASKLCTGPASAVLVICWLLDILLPRLDKSTVAWDISSSAKAVADSRAKMASKSNS